MLKFSKRIFCGSKNTVVFFSDLTQNSRKNSIDQPPSSIRKKREIDLGDLGLDGLGLGEDILKGLIEKITELLTDGASSLGLDKLGLDKEVIEGIIEKIVNLIVDGFGGGSDNSDGGDENATEAPAEEDGASSLGLDKLGLDKEVIEGLIEKIVNLIVDGFGGGSDESDAGDGDETASEAPAEEGSEAATEKAKVLRRKKREVDLGSIGLNGLGLGDDVVKELTTKITSLMDGISGLGLDKLGLGNDAVKKLIKKIIDKIDAGGNGGEGGDGSATEAPPAAATTLGCRPHIILCFF
uniref:Uncharacterized protein n=1 Tax=Panagrolaimus sp. ES5 TaxID=591445 RepID=A0AC34FP36_9BILA